MNNTPAKKSVIAEITVLSVFLLCMLLVLLVHRDPGYERYANAVTPFFILQPDSVREDTIFDYAGVKKTYTFTLPDTDTATTTGSRFTVFLRHTIARYAIEDSDVFNDFSPDNSVIGKTPGNCWISIPVRPAYGGKTVTLELIPVYESVADEEPVFMVIGRDELISLMVLPRDRLILILSLSAVVFGLILMILVLFMPLSRAEKRRVFYIGAVTVTAGLWKLSGLTIVPLLLDYRGIHKEIWFTGSLSYLLMMVLSVRLLTLLRSDDENRPGRICFYIAAISASLLVILQLFRVLELHNALIWYGLGMALLHLAALLGKKPTRSELFLLLPFFISMGIDLIIYLITGSMQKAPAFLIWMILNLFLRGFGFVREAILRERLLRKQEEALKDARVRTMMNQIRPHFIYNTLTSIYVLCREDPERAANVVKDFTEYLQSNFSAISAEEPIAFSEELQHTKAYAAVEALRYGDKLSIDYDIAHTAFRLPPLTLQPLVENAIKHCLGKGIGPEHIRVSSRAENGFSVITVEDDGPGIDTETLDPEVHVGLNNVRERLMLMCGGSLKTESLPEKGARVTVSIPFTR